MTEDRAILRERYRKRLAWLYSVTLLGVVLLLAAQIAPSYLNSARAWGIGLTLAGGLLQIMATWDYARRV